MRELREMITRIEKEHAAARWGIDRAGRKLEVAISHAARTTENRPGVAPQKASGAEKQRRLS
jgi:hypothetical protein